MKKLFNEVQAEFKKLSEAIAQVPEQARNTKCIEGTGGKVSVLDLIAYQIGWGKLLIGWYEAGVNGEMPEMPGEGFTTWNYTEIAKHFYKKYTKNQEEEFEKVVFRILQIIETEENLDQIGVWSWCKLTSGKEWPLSKWIRVNTVSPYKRATKLIRKI